jgi:trans-2,3-dihydro-3-hydroxyanthranilate isomerase
VARLRYRLVDVFTDTPLRGNPLAVVLDPCPVELMQAVAREFNLNETTFPVLTGPDSYSMRIFTQTMEVPFAGHPTLGTAWALGPGRWTQVTSGATVTVEADERGARMTQPDVTFEPLDEERDELVASLGLASAEAVTRADIGGMVHALVATAEPLDRLDPDLNRVADVSRRCRAHTVVPLRSLGPSELHARVFGPASGFSEDPGSGSAAGPVALFARELWEMEERLTVAMGAEIGRPSRLDVDLSNGAVVVGGDVVASAEGELSLG